MDTEKCDGMGRCQKDRAIKVAQEQAVREHQWEHKGPVLAMAQMAKAPGKMIARSDIIAILRAQRGISGSVVDAEYDRLISIFSNVE